MAVFLKNDVIGIHVKDVFFGRIGKGGAAGCGEVTGPLVEKYPIRVSAGDGNRLIGRSGIDDIDLVDQIAYGFQTAGQHGFLVLDDHAEAD